MRDGRDLLLNFSVPPEATQASTMLVFLEGFMDAGKAAGAAVDTLQQFLPHRTVADFDTDQLIDYRGRRPPMDFNGKRFTSMAWPELEVVLLFDEQEQPFYVLSGPEPDYQWFRFADAVQHLVRELGVTLVATGQGVPWAAPHTRPLRRLTHASRDELIGTRPGWSQHVKVPGHLTAVLEMRLNRGGVDTVSQSVQVPHYLADLLLPQAASCLIDGWADVTGLSLPHGDLVELGEPVMEQIDAQTQNAPEMAQAISELERAYDNDLTHDDSPWGEHDIAGQVEQFLRDLGDDPDPRPGG